MPARVPKADVLDDIRRVAEKLDRTPSRSEYDEHGEYSGYTAENKFGTWTNARAEAGLNGGPEKNEWVDKDRVITELQRVAKELGHAPSQAEFNESADITHQVAYERFGSFNKAKEAAGLESWRDDRIPDEKLLSDIKSVADKVSAVPSQSTYNEHGGHGLSVVKRRFGGWKTAVRKAGFEPRTVGPPAGEENPAWRGGYEPYYGPNWYKQREKARERDDYRCQSCGLKDTEHKEEYDCELEIHHIVAARTFEDYEEMNRLNNLVTLCSGCHQRYEHLPIDAAKKLIESE